MDQRGKSIFERWKMHGGDPSSTAKSLDAMLEKVKEDGVLRNIPHLRKAILHALGLRRTPNAENMIITGCLTPFGMPFQIQAYFRLLDRLGIEYTFSREKEYCCGNAWVQAAKPSEYDHAEALSKEALQLNVQLAHGLGAKKMFYFCYMCFTLADKLLCAEGVEQGYFLDLLKGRIECEKLSVKPTHIAYYEGCWGRSRAIYPDLHIDLKTYREWLDRIEGLKVTDLPTHCCVLIGERVLAEAEKLGVNCIVTHCAGCMVTLDRINRGKIPLKFMPELLLEALSGPGKE